MIPLSHFRRYPSTGEARWANPDTKWPLIDQTDRSPPACGSWEANVNPAPSETVGRL